MGYATHTATATAREYTTSHTYIVKLANRQSYHGYTQTNAHAQTHAHKHARALISNSGLQTLLERNAYRLFISVIKWLWSNGYRAVPVCHQQTARQPQYATRNAKLKRTEYDVPHRSYTNEAVTFVHFTMNESTEHQCQWGRSVIILFSWYPNEKLVGVFRLFVIQLQ